jgi:hypothetical protein
MPLLEIEWNHLETWVAPLVMRSFFGKPEKDESWSVLWVRKCSERVHELFFASKKEFIDFMRMKTHEYIMATLLVQRIKEENPRSHVNWRFCPLETDVHRGRDIFLIEGKIGVPVDLTTNPEKSAHKPVLIATLEHSAVTHVAKNLKKHSFLSEQEFTEWMSAYKSLTESVRLSLFWQPVKASNIFQSKNPRKRKDF